MAEKLKRPTDGSVTVLAHWPKTGKDGKTPGGQPIASRGAKAAAPEPAPGKPSEKPAAKP